MRSFGRTRATTGPRSRTWSCGSVGTGGVHAEHWHRRLLRRHLAPHIQLRAVHARRSVLADCTDPVLAVLPEQQGPDTGQAGPGPAHARAQPGHHVRRRRARALQARDRLRGRLHRRGALGGVRVRDVRNAAQLRAGLLR
uniref:Uncharacterized protein n=1 Tax=Ixodes scapularis TaxID=6945 RepID=A0A4D5RVI6_IXOSC